MSNSSIQILLVEDNSADAVLLREVLKEAKHNRFSITHVKRLDEAMKSLATTAFDVLLLDLGLPDSQGLKTLKRIQEVDHAIPIVVLTGLDDEAMALGALSEGAQDYLVKGEAAGEMLPRLIRYAIERKRIEERLTASQELLILAVEATKLGVFDRNLKTGKATWSYHHARLFGMPPEKFGGTFEAFLACVHPDDRPGIAEQVEQARIAGGLFTLEYRVVWPDGSIHWMDVLGSVHRDDAGVADRMFGTVRDITERRTAEEKARQQEAELAHLSRVSLMGQMASGLAHELNQPLGTILNYAHICLEQAESGNVVTPQMKTGLREIMNETRRAGSIISRMRSFVQRQKLKTAFLNVNQLVAEAIGIMGFEFRHQGIRPDLKLAEPIPLVSADAIQIEQVLVNLIFNALEAMDESNAPRKQLTVESETIEGDRIILVRVIDTGPGVHPDHLPKLFDAFFTTKTKGMGMGLNISRSIIESHGGRLLASVNPSGGMCFSFTLPAAEVANQ